MTNFDQIFKVLERGLRPNATIIFGFQLTVNLKYVEVPLPDSPRMELAISSDDVTAAKVAPFFAENPPIRYPLPVFEPVQQAAVASKASRTAP